MRPNVVFLLTDQWRLQDLGYAGNAQVQTPNTDRLAGESTNFTHAISGWPLCSPWRASLLTGQYPLTHGVFTNDLPIGSDPVGMGDAFKRAGYDTACIGKWHANGQGRTSYTPPERRLGFDYFKVLECTHDYNRSEYYAGDDDEKRVWNGYDVFAQADDAMAYIRDRESENPFMLLLSWGPPHNPYDTAPEAFRELYQPEEIALRPNVPADWEERAREWIAGYLRPLQRPRQERRRHPRHPRRGRHRRRDHRGVRIRSRGHARLAGSAAEAAPLGGVDPGAVLGPGTRAGRRSRRRPAERARHPADAPRPVRRGDPRHGGRKRLQHRPRWRAGPLGGRRADRKLLPPCGRRAAGANTGACGPAATPTPASSRAPGISTTTTTTPTSSRTSSTTRPTPELRSDLERTLQRLLDEQGAP